MSGKRIEVKPEQLNNHKRIEKNITNDLSEVVKFNDDNKLVDDNGEASLPSANLNESSSFKMIRS